MEMEEIVDDDELKPLNDNGDRSKVEILVRIVGPARPTRLLVPSPIPVQDLRKLIATENQLPIGKLRLILRGNVLHDIRNGDHVDLHLKNGDSLIVLVKPNPASKNLGDGLDEDDDEDEDLKFRLPESSSRWKRKVYSFLHEKLKLPDLVLMAIFSLSLTSWVFIAMWFILAPVASRFGLGPLYIIGTGFVLILMNLGKRKPGEVSAYSIFNENFQELPGTLNADRLDRDIRAGHL